MNVAACRWEVGPPVARSRARRRFAGLLLAAALLAGCDAPGNAVAPQEMTRDTICALDGMVPMDYPGPKAQIHYDDGAPDFFCDTLDMMSMLLRPEQQRRIAAVFTQDMGKTDWIHPEGHWIDARTAFYVIGSSRTGSMGPTLASFGAEVLAKDFASKYGGTVLRFGEITLQMARLRGGALEDERM